MMPLSVSSRQSFGRMQLVIDEPKIPARQQDGGKVRGKRYGVRGTAFKISAVVSGNITFAG
jgi:hypothetical protein